MRRLYLIAFCLVSSAFAYGKDQPDSDSDGQTLYQQHCASCHGADRLGGVGPALLPGNLSRLRQKAAVKVIAQGRPATQMPGFGDRLNAAQIAALADLIYTPPAQPPRWTLADIRASHRVNHPPGSLPNRPVFEVDDLLNLFIVVELGDHHATLLDGDRLEPIHRFPTRPTGAMFILPRATAGLANSIFIILKP